MIVYYSSKYGIQYTSSVPSGSEVPDESVIFRENWFCCHYEITVLVGHRRVANAKAMITF